MENKRIIIYIYLCPRLLQRTVCAESADILHTIKLSKYAKLDLMQERCKLLLLLLVTHFTLCGTEVVQTLFKNSCRNESVLYSQRPYHTLRELSVIKCAVECAVDVNCAAYSHPPCVLYSEE